jgi:two-component system C4-dicarboxylate transport response regulator DctD
MTYSKRVLFIDDEASVRQSIDQWLGLADFDVTCFEPGEEILEWITPEFDGILVTDVKMPKISGLELMRKSISIDPDLPVILITGHGDVAMAVEALRDGAYDFIEKPFKPENLIDTLNRACEKRRLVMSNRQLRRNLQGDDTLNKRLIGTSPQIESLRKDIRFLADINTSVLIHGETGSGKEVVAQSLHDMGNRVDGNFVALNSAAIPDELFEGELFGHEPGAYTGAGKARIGKLEYASGGTLFLDEIESMPISAQLKLLRVLENQTIERLGSNKEIKLDLRIVAATKSDLLELSEKGEFRKDLYYRLNVTELFIPPVRERAGDISVLFDFFLSEAARLHSLTAPQLTEDDQTILEAQPWPGNVRELKNIADRYIFQYSRNPGRTLADILVDGSHSAQTSCSGTSGKLTDLVQSYEKLTIEKALSRCNGNVKQVIGELGVPRRTLNQKMQRYGIDRSNLLAD